MDGWQFLAHLRSTPGGSEVPVLVLSGSPRQRWDAEQVTGVMEYLPKPFHLRDMLDEVQFLYEFARSRPCCSDKYAA
jgi:CheY-like chemotaxis protein